MKSFEREVLSDKKTKARQNNSWYLNRNRKARRTWNGIFYALKDNGWQQDYLSQQNYFSELKEKRKNVDNKNRVKELRTTKSIFTEDS